MLSVMFPSNEKYVENDAFNSTSNVKSDVAWCFNMWQKTINICVSTWS